MPMMQFPLRFDTVHKRPCMRNKVKEAVNCSQILAQFQRKIYCLHLLLLLH